MWRDVNHLCVKRNGVRQVGIGSLTLRVGPPDGDVTLELVLRQGDKVRLDYGRNEWEFVIMRMTLFPDEDHKR